MRDQDVTQCVAICFRLCWRLSYDLLVCFGAKPTQRTEDEISRETGSRGEKEGPRKDREGSWKSRAEETNRLEIAVRRRRWAQSTEVCIASGLWEFLSSSRSRQLTKCKVSQTPSSCAWSWPKSVFFPLFSFFHPLGCAFVSVKKCVIPLVRNEKKTTRRIIGHE